MIIKIQLNQICNIEIEGIDINDYPDFVDAYISNASWKNGKELSFGELDYLNNVYPEFVYEQVIKQLY